MALEPLTDFVSPEEAGAAASRLFAAPPDIRILIYTDDHTVKDANDETSPFGLGLLRKFMTAQPSAFGRPLITVVNRNGDSCETQHHASRRLTDLLPVTGGGFDQVWFFGIHMANLTEVKCTGSFANLGGPDSELTDEEVTRLRVWMQTGGVLVTGDHSSGRSDIVKDPALPPILSLGRALGHRVPRAGQLRTWQGGPTTDDEDSHNTHDASCGRDLNDEEFQRDGIPQRLIALRLNPRGQLDPELGDPHCLFQDRNGCAIDVFPDHMHEGEVILFSGDWPPGARKPFVVAVGTDKRVGKTYNLVAVAERNGGASPTERIVVDSTWHHYFNVNLLGFDGDMSEGSVADRLGQYYYNLAVWLSPKETLRKMARAMFWWLASYPITAEEGGGPSSRIGSTAKRVLARVASPCHVNEMLLAYTPEEARSEFPLLRYPERGLAFGPLPSQELILGSVLREYFHEMGRPAADLGGPHAVGEACDRVIEAGFRKAFEAHAETLRSTRSQARKFRRSFL